MGLCAAMFHWPPDVFWRSTAHEIYAALEAAQKMNNPHE